MQIVTYCICLNRMNITMVKCILYVFGLFRFCQFNQHSNIFKYMTELNSSAKVCLHIARGTSHIIFSRDTVSRIASSRARLYQNTAARRVQRCHVTRAINTGACVRLRLYFRGHSNYAGDFCDLYQFPCSNMLTSLAPAVGTTHFTS